MESVLKSRGQWMYHHISDLKNVDLGGCFLQKAPWDSRHKLVKEADMTTRKCSCCLKTASRASLQRSSWMIARCCHRVSFILSIKLSDGSGDEGLTIACRPQANVDWLPLEKGTYSCGLNSHRKVGGVAWRFLKKDRWRGEMKMIILPHSCQITFEKNKKKRERIVLGKDLTLQMTCKTWKNDAESGGVKGVSENCNVILMELTVVQLLLMRVSSRA